MVFLEAHVDGDGVGKSWVVEKIDREICGGNETCVIKTRGHLKMNLRQTPEETGVKLRLLTTMRPCHKPCNDPNLNTGPLAMGIDQGSMQCLNLSQSWSYIALQAFSR
jgi:hypothetical protein